MLRFSRSFHSLPLPLPAHSPLSRATCLSHKRILQPLLPSHAPVYSRALHPNVSVNMCYWKEEVYVGCGHSVVTPSESGKCDNVASHDECTWRRYPTPELVSGMCSNCQYPSPVSDRWRWSYHGRRSHRRSRYYYSYYRNYRHSDLYY